MKRGENKSFVDLHDFQATMRDKSQHVFSTKRGENKSFLDPAKETQIESFCKTNFTINDQYLMKNAFSLI